MRPVRCRCLPMASNSVTLHDMRFTLHYNALNSISFLEVVSYITWTWRDNALHWNALYTLYEITLHCIGCRALSALNCIALPFIYIRLHHITQSLHCIMLHYTTWHGITLHCIHHIALHCIALHYMTPCYTKLRSIRFILLFVNVLGSSRICRCSNVSDPN